MNRIYERFMDAADVDMPPSRLSADEVYAAAWHRRRRRVEVWTSATVVVVLLATIVAMQVKKTPAGNDAAVAPEPTPTVIGQWPMGTRDGGVVFAAATDAEHLYAVITRCTETDCTTQLVGSDDAGATWTVRQTDLGQAADYHVTAPAAGVLYRTVERRNRDEDGPPDADTPFVRIPKISKDGGRTWTDVQAGTAPVAAVPANGWLECTSEGQDACRRLLVVDPDTARSAPLATGPAFEKNSVVNVPAAAGFWVTGYDVEKGTPAVAVSTDRGRTWNVHPFTAEPAGSAIRPSSVDGVTGYAIVSQYHEGKVTGTNPTPGPASSTHRVYRTENAGQTWQRVDTGTALFDNTVDVEGYVARDGTHYVMTLSGWVRRWYMSNDNGHSYRWGRPSGLGDRLGLANARMHGVVTHAPGVYLAFDDEAVYRSTDGRRFTRHPVRN